MIVRRSTFHLGAQVGAAEFRVLVADDCAANRRLLEALFTSCGCSVSVVEDGAEAISAALSQHFDLVCLDRHMPQASGDEVAQTIRSTHGRGPRPYLVLSTSDPRPGDAPYAFDAAMPKPVSPHDVVAVVAKALHTTLARGAGPGRLDPAAAASAGLS
jgi:CheY-like chemotaxis protein